MVCWAMIGQEQVRKTDNGCQHVVEIMRVAACEFPNGFHLLALSELLPQRAFFRRVGQVDDSCCRAVVALGDLLNVQPAG